jgi:hypothetical protein
MGMGSRVLCPDSHLDCDYRRTRASTTPFSSATSPTTSSPSPRLVEPSPLQESGTFAQRPRQDCRVLIKLQFMSLRTGWLQLISVGVVYDGSSSSVFVLCSSREGSESWAWSQPSLLLAG